MRFIPLIALLGTMTIAGCAAPQPFEPSAALSGEDNSSSYVDTSSPPMNDTTANDALLMSDQMAATQAANDAAQAQNNAAQEAATQTMINANNSAPPQ